jgi:hypothetical protein
MMAKSEWKNCGKGGIKAQQERRLHMKGINGTFMEGRARNINWNGSYLILNERKFS